MGLATQVPTGWSRLTSLIEAAYSILPFWSIPIYVWQLVALRPSRAVRARQASTCMGRTAVKTRR